MPSTKRKKEEEREASSKRAASSSSAEGWRVVRCAAKDAATRKQQGNNRSPMTKPECTSVELRMEGVVGWALGGLFGLLPARKIEDFNKYRSTGDSHKGFKPGTNDRAVMIVCDSVYAELREALPVAPPVNDGDIGENLLIAGPAYAEGRDLCVGTQLRVGTAVLELTEANNPCYRLGFLPWAKHAKARFGEKWWDNPALPLSKEAHPGGRGWLCKVVVEGTVRPGDGVVKLR